MNELKELLEKSQRILITAHLGPDADSLCSSLLLQAILKENFKDKSVAICMEEDYEPLSFLNGYSSIKFEALEDGLKSINADLLIILDGNNVPRCTRNPDLVREYIKNNGVKVVVIDHHIEIDVEPGSTYINQKSPAVTQDIYEICFDKLGLIKPANYAQTAMIGLYSDTGGFTYDNLRYKATFKMAAELIEDGASTELAASQITQYSRYGLEVLEELIKNVKQADDCTYAYISDGFYEKWKSANRPADAIHEGFDIFLHNFIRNIEGRIWGFTIYPDPKAKVKTYSVSFRSLQGKVDVSVFARELGGGGHKPAAGAKIECNSVEEALDKVKAAISSVK